MLQLNKSLRTAGIKDDVSAEIRYARKKSRDKVKSYPDSETVGNDNDEDETVHEQPTPSAEPADTGASLSGWFACTRSCARKSHTFCHAGMCMGVMCDKALIKDHSCCDIFFYLKFLLRKDQKGLVHFARS